MGNKFMQNIGWKIASLLLAILVWIYVIGDVDPVTQKIFKDIPIEIENTQAIKDKYPSYPDGKSTDVTIEARRSVVDSLRKQDIHVTADMSELSITYAVILKVHVDKEDVIAKAVNPVWNVNLEEYADKTVDVTASIQGSPAMQYVMGDVTVEPNIILIKGPESKVAQVQKVIINDVDVEGKTKDVILEGKPIALNENDVELPEIDFDVETVKVHVPIYKTKTVRIKVDFTGEVPGGYQKTNETLDPTEVIIKGPAKDVDAIEEINLGTINLSEYKETTDIQLSIIEALPEGIKLLNTTQPSIANVNIEIQPYKSREFTYAVSDVAIYNVPKGLKLSLVTEEDLVVKVAGLQSDIDELVKERISLRANLKDLAVGIHDIPITIYKPSGITLQGEPPLLRIELVKDETIIATTGEENPEVAKNNPPEVVEVLDPEAIEEPDFISNEGQ